MYFVNSSGKSVKFTHQGKEYFILAWKHVDLPEELYDIIEIHKIPLEVDYHRYISEEVNEQIRFDNAKFSVEDNCVIYKR